ncbi:plasmid pRiA4b ORF-3 family protein [Paenibacillus sp. GCM10023252]|uniref:plasmid pRiA4b ORF-3 family protein n=1 Tax=Paenibacillus sp. GCM10023252 TaxID=3252649 RepID=UPI00361232FC
MSRPREVYQFKISLKGAKPPVWRRIQVPKSYTFWDLHVAIQDVMGWHDSHLHEFSIRNPKNGRKMAIGVPNYEFDSREVLQGWSNKILNYFKPDNKVASYVYDFGDYWEHRIEFEGVFPSESSVEYPICLAGKRACPPEDCGGIHAYQMILENDHPMQEEYDWFEPDSFNKKEVVFSDPKARFDQNFELIEDVE